VGSNPLIDIFSPITKAFLWIGMMAPKATRRLHSHNIEAKGRYLMQLLKYCKKHKVFTRLINFEETKPLVWSAVNTLDMVITRGMLHAEKHCRYRGCDPWSPVLKKAKVKVEIYKLALGMAKTKKDLRRQIDQLVGLYGNLLEIPDPIPEVQVALQKAQKELKTSLQSAILDQKDTAFESSIFMRRTAT
jgi:hypothetical protein